MMPYLNLSIIGFEPMNQLFQIRHSGESRNLVVVLNYYLQNRFERKL